MSVQTRIRTLGLALVLGAGATGTTSCDQVASVLSEIADERGSGGIEMSATPVGDGWHIVFIGIRGRPSNLVVRFGDTRTETFRSPFFELPTDLEGPMEITLLEYELHGKVIRGPFRFDFDPKKAHVLAAKDALEQLRAQWVGWRRYAGSDILQLSFLNSHTCGIDHVDYGFADEPDQKLPLHECGGEHATPYSDLRFEIDEKTHVVLQVTFADGTKSKVRRFPNPSYETGSSGTVTMNRALVMSDTSDAKVHVDGEYRCDAPCEVKVPVDGREHEIRLEKEGYEDLVKSWKPDGVADPLPELGPMKRERVVSPEAGGL